MTQINIQFTLFSAFYSPLISTISGRFLQEEGLEPKWSVASPGVSAIAALEDGSAHVVQSAVSQGFTTLAKGEVPRVVHFAQINEADGFFLTGRSADSNFTWSKLEGADVILFGGGQPLIMFKYACYKAGIDYNKINSIHVGGAADMDKAFREGKGQYVQQQGPFPQQLEADQIGHIVADVGKQVGPCAFSSLVSTPDWLAGDMAKAFMRGYIKTRHYLNETSAKEIALAEKSFFPNIDLDALTSCIDTYQKAGCWTPHVDITRAAYEATLDIYEQCGGLMDRYDYDLICAAPPSSI
ncbi:MAG: ABC transporter substrate-binding protein [Sneathiella sp.]|nr:ABC transporter substrate-binding protein [Sneathiella sp.]